MRYDGIILGAGHNSLVLQAYCSRAGMKTLSLEKSQIAGGGLSTMEDPRHPGFLHNTHSYFHRAITEMPWYRDLELDYRGAKYFEPELNTALVLKSGEALKWYTDFEKTVASFASFSERDAQTLQKWKQDFSSVVEKILGPEALRVPMEPEKRNHWLDSLPEGRLLKKVSRFSPLEFVMTEFENPIIQAGLLFFNGLREVDLRCKGMGYHIPMLLASKRKAQACYGGSASLARALVHAVRDAGGEIRYQATPKRILTNKKTVTGVELETGEVISADWVASGLNPHQTFLDLLGNSDLPREWRTYAEKFQYNLIAPLFSLNLNLHEAPAYCAEEKHPDLQQALMVILGLEHLDQYPQIVKAHENGQLPPPVMWGSTPTMHDPSQAPAGKHVSFMWEKLPYRLNGNPASWDAARKPHGEAMLRFWEQYAPNLGRAVIDWFTRSPADVERSFPNMKEGDLLIGAFTNGQLGYNRPFPGAGEYRGYFDGLYLCGSCTHPGGNITGLPGYNAAHVLLQDHAGSAANAILPQT